MLRRLAHPGILRRDLCGRRNVPVKLKMNIFFDVDYTLVGGMDGSLRPGVREVFQRLKKDGHHIYVWSGVGPRWHEVRRHQLESLVIDCFTKPITDYYQQMKAMNLPVEPDLVVDDFPQVAQALGGISVAPYTFENANDREMERVYQTISSYAQNGHSDDHRFAPKLQK